MKLSSIWSNLDHSFEPLNEGAYAAWLKLAQAQGLETGWISYLAAMMIFAGEPYDLSQYMFMFPYGDSKVHTRRFSYGIQHGFLTYSQPGVYRATPAGLVMKEQFMQTAMDTLTDLTLLPSDKFERLLGVLERLCLASLSAPEPPTTFGFSHYYRNMHPGQDTLQMRLYVHYFASLDKYRGNAHRSTWEHFGIEGNRWEVFSEVWQGKNNTLDLIFAELKSREISVEAYAGILEELCQRGWIEVQDGVYRLTEDGRRIRTEAENLTDRYFFAPWACLSAAELDDLGALAEQVAEGIAKRLGSNS